MAKRNSTLLPADGFLVTELITSGNGYTFDRMQGKLGSPVQLRQQRTQCNASKFTYGYRIDYLALKHQKFWLQS